MIKGILVPPALLEEMIQTGDLEKALSALSRFDVRPAWAMIAGLLVQGHGLQGFNETNLLGKLTP